MTFPPRASTDRNHIVNHEQILTPSKVRPSASDRGSIILGALSRRGSFLTAPAIPRRFFRHTTRSSMPPPVGPSSEPLKFVAFSSLAKVDFWTGLAARKLDRYRLNDDAQPICGFYGSGHEARAPCRLLLLGESFSTDTDGEVMAGPGARFEECRTMGYIKNVNTKEAFKELDKPAVLASIAREIWEDTTANGRAIVEPERLLRFLLVTFADLKKSAFLHWFAFPTLGSQALFRQASRPAPASSVLSPAACSATVEGISQLWAASMESTKRPGCPPFFAMVRTESEQGVDDVYRVLSLSQYEEGKNAGEQDYDKVIFGFIDPSSDPRGIPGWPLRNFLALLSARWGIRRARVLCFREYVPRPSSSTCFSTGGQGSSADAPGADEGTATVVANLSRSVMLDIDLSAAPAPDDKEGAGRAWLPPRVGSLGWEPNAAGRAGPRMSDLSSVLDPSRLAENSVRLNIKLMRWRAMPELDVDLLAQTKCLLLGAGTLGCAVARCLMGWGVQHITLADNGRVSYSNPVRQSLFSFEDCKGGGRLKATAAAEALRAVYPGAKSAGHVLTIPMPGHPQTSEQERAKARQDAETLEELVSTHDVVYILTDSRESRWLPTVLSAKYDKICVNAALGLNSFLVVRHGAGANSAAAGGDSLPRLGCYFCTDVVAPENSSLNRTLDQQCTVTRPGLAPMAAATAVELTVGLLHHPLRQRAPADDSAGRAKGMGQAAAAAAGQGNHPLGALPHQVRGFMASFSTVTPSALAFDRCTACSAAVVSAFETQGWEFVESACRSPQVLEEVSGLQELRTGLDAVDVDLDWGVDEELEDEA